ncbi:hypothetical protein CCM_02354 [Cordyceps militaris CM01]|uniref:Uncharacterized protein n=1 Tax=Cordyceps militaris (strain CM01) TaxID=983644 RepID=G3J9A4_CORMM|nr:uncharacterized protein CCM_02354 [Cordyceps militaris CM01]EGX94083.1 hypothetical protein CCM_02354 [Cordyceps militaris CM01]
MCGQEIGFEGKSGRDRGLQGSYGQAFERMSAPCWWIDKLVFGAACPCSTSPDLPASAAFSLAGHGKRHNASCQLLRANGASRANGRPIGIIGMQPTTSQPDHPLLTTYIPRHDIHVHVHVDYTDHLPMRPRSPPKLSLSSLHWLLKKGRQPRRTPFPYLVVQHESWLVLVPVHAPA